MPLRVAQFALLVRDYDEAIAFYVGVLGFTLLEDTDRGQGKRWVRVGSPAPTTGTASGGPSAILLARATTPEQLAAVGRQAGGRVFLFVDTDDFDRDYQRLKAVGVKFRGEPRTEDYGRVIVLEDLYGNPIDLIQPKNEPAPE